MINVTLFFVLSEECRSNWNTQKIFTVYCETIASYLAESQFKRVTRGK